MKQLIQKFKYHDKYVFKGRLLYKKGCMNIKLMKGKAPRKHSLHEKTAASVLLKLFISSMMPHNWRPLAHERNSIF